MRELLDPIGPDPFQCGEDGVADALARPVLGLRGQPQCNIVEEGAGEGVDILADKHRPGMARCHGDAPLPGFQQPRNKGRQGRLACPRLPDKHHGVSGRNVQTHRVQYIGSVLIAKAHPIHVDRRRPALVPLGDGRFVVAGLDDAHHSL